MKKLFILGCSLASLGAFAADGDSSYDFTAVTTEVTNLKTALSGWMTTALPVIIGIVGVFLGPWLFRLVFKWVKSLANKA